MAAIARQRLSPLNNDLRCAESAKRVIASFFKHMKEHAANFGSLLLALEEQLMPPRLVILAGPGEALFAFQAVLVGTYMPTPISFAIANGTDSLH